MGESVCERTGREGGRGRVRVRVSRQEKDDAFYIYIAQVNEISITYAYSVQFHFEYDRADDTPCGLPTRRSSGRGSNAVSPSW